MANPYVQGPLIQISSNIDAFVTSHIVFQGVELLSSIGSGGEEDNSIVPSVPKGGPAPSFFVHDGLELLLGDVGSRIGCSPIAEHNSWGLAHFGKTSEIVLSIHLEADQQTLEADPLLDVELAHHDHPSRLHYKSGDLRD
jgi:hypothetical protein